MRVNQCNAAGITASRYRRMLIKELFRKSIHLCSAFVPLVLHFAYWPIMIAMLVVLAFYIVSEILRMKGITVPVVSAVTAAAARKRDENRFVLGPVTLVSGIWLSAFLWNEKAYTIGIFALAFGDGLASLAGKFFGKVHIPLTGGKTVAGSLTCFAAILISSLCVCRNPGIALIIALIGMVIELLPLKDFDNLLIPVLLGGIAQLLLA